MALCIAENFPRGGKGRKRMDDAFGASVRVTPFKFKFHEDFWCGKSTVPRYRATFIARWSVLSRSNTTSTHDGRTDGRTDRQSCYITIALSIPVLC